MQIIHFIRNAVNHTIINSTNCEVKRTMETLNKWYYTIVKWFTYHIRGPYHHINGSVFFLYFSLAFIFIRSSWLDSFQKGERKSFQKPLMHSFETANKVDTLCYRSRLCVCLYKFAVITEKWKINQYHIPWYSKHSASRSFALCSIPHSNTLASNKDYWFVIYRFNSKVNKSLYISCLNVTLTGSMHLHPI